MYIIRKSIFKKISLKKVYIYFFKGLLLKDVFKDTFFRRYFLAAKNHRTPL